MDRVVYRKVHVENLNYDEFIVHLEIITFDTNERFIPLVLTQNSLHENDKC